MTIKKTAALQTTRNGNAGIHSFVLPLAGMAFLAATACTGQTAPVRTTTTAAPVGINLDLTASTERLRDSLSLIEGQTDKVLVPLHMALEIRSGGKSYFRDVVKDGQEITLDLPIGEVETRALVLIEARPTNWRDFCGQKSTSSPSPTASPSASASPSGSTDSRDRNNGITYVAAVEQKLSVTNDTNELGIRLGDLKEVGWRKLAAKLPVSLTSTAAAGGPRIFYADAISMSPIVDPCTGQPFSDKSNGDITEMAVPKSEIAALAGSDFRPFSPAAANSTGRLEWIRIDPSVLALPAELQSAEYAAAATATPYPTSSPGTMGNDGTSAPGYPSEPKPVFATVDPVTDGTAAFRLALLSDEGDADGDGVSNADELKQNTNPLAKPVAFVINLTAAAEGGRVSASLQQDAAFRESYRDTRCEIFVDTSSLSAIQKSNLEKYRNQLSSSMINAGSGPGPMIPPLNSPMSFPCGGWLELQGVAGTVTISFSVSDRFGANAGKGSITTPVAVPALATPPTVTPPTTFTPPPNSAPYILQNGQNSVNTASGSSVNIGLSKGSDPDNGQGLGYLVTANPNNGVLSQLPQNARIGGNVTYTPNGGFVGNVSFTYQICDNAPTPLCTGPISVVVTVLAANQAPTNITLSTATVTENAGTNALVGFLGAVDPDVNDTFAFNLVTNVGDAAAFVIDGNQLRLITNPDFEAKNRYDIRIKVRDQGGAGLSFDKDFSITVLNLNEMPTISNAPSSPSTMEDTPLTNIGVVIGDPDGPLNCTTNLTVTSNDQALLPDSNIIVGGSYPNCSLNLTPAPNKNGSATVTLTVFDGTDSDQTQFLLTVTPANDAPAFAIAGATSKVLAVNESGSIQLASATDADGDLLSYVIISAPTQGTLSTIPSNAATSSNVTYTPNNGVSGLDSFSYKICDNANTQLCTNAITVTIDVGGNNSAPTSISLSSVNVVENSTAPFFSATLSASDPDAGEVFVYSLVAGAGDSDNNAFTISGNSLTLNGPANFEAKSNYSLRIQVRDKNGAGLTYSNQFSIWVSDVNEAPSDIQLSNTTVVENSAPGTVVGSFTPSDPDGGGSFTYSLIAGAGGDDNSAFAISSGFLSMNTSPDFETKNSYLILVRVTDSGGMSFEKAFTIAINNLNESPNITVAQNQSTNEDSPLLDIPVTVSDPEGTLSSCSGAIMVLSNDPTLLPDTNISRAGSAPNCTISLYPAANKFGTASIELKAFDGSLYSPLKTITFTVYPTNDAPVFQGGGDAGGLSTPQNTPRNITLFNGADLDNDPLSYVIVTGTLNGITSAMPSNATTGGTIVYTPNTNYNGMDTLRYKICDNGSPQLCTAVREVAITVGSGAPSGWQRESYIKAANAGADDFFGSSVSLSGDSLAVGAYGEDSGQMTITTGSTATSDNSSLGSGAVYLYRRSGANWDRQAYIKASNAETNDNFGHSVSLSGDLLAVGANLEDENMATIVNGTTAPNANGAAESGAVYLYRRTGTAWEQEAYIKASNAQLGDNFGIAVSISGDTIAVGAYGEDENTTTVINGTTSPNSDGATDAGAVYIYRRAGTSWQQEAYLKAANAATYDFFGTSVSLSGDTIAVGAYGEDENSTVILNGTTAPNSDGADSAGAVYVFRRNGIAWAQEAYLKAANTSVQDSFGYAISLSGDTLAVGAFAEDENTTSITNGSTAPNANGANASGAVYIFRRSGSAWNREAYVKATNTGADDNFGAAVSLSGDTLAVGARREDENSTLIVNGTTAPNIDGASLSGAVYIYRRTGSSWAAEAYVKAANTQASDNFGVSVSISGDSLAVGANQEDENSTAIMNGSSAPNINGAFNSGAVYVYRNNSRPFDPDVRVIGQTQNSITFAWAQNIGPAGAQVIVAPASTGDSTPVSCQLGNAGGSLSLSPGTTTYIYSGLTAGARDGFRFCSANGTAISGGSTIWFDTLP